MLFSLDLSEGRPLIAPGANWTSTSPLDMIGAARAAGCRRFLIVDLARVGSGRGLGTLDLAALVVERFPDVNVSVGGGVSSRDDLEAAARAGIQGVLLGSALHDGRLTRDDFI